MIKYFLILTFIMSASCTAVRRKSSGYHSVVYTEYGAAAYSAENVKKYISYLKSVGANTASILMTCQTKGQYTNDIDCESDNSPKKENIIKVIERLKKRGFKVSLRVYVDLLDGKWRAYWDPKNKKKVFLDLKKRLVEYGKLSEKYGVDLFVLGAEYEKLTQPEFKEEWLGIIAEVRKVYNGKITYGANSNYSTYKTPEYQWVPFWKALDFVGIDHYPAFEGEPIKPALIEHHHKYLKRYQSVEQSRPIYFNEVGFPSSSLGHKKPYQWIWKKEVANDFDQQALNIESFLESLKEKNVSGLALWRFMPGEKKTYPKGYNIDSSQTVRSIKKGFQQL